MASELRHRAAGSGVDSGAYKLRLQYPGSDPTVIQCLVDPDQKVSCLRKYARTHPSFSHFDTVTLIVRGSVLQDDNSLIREVVEDKSSIMVGPPPRAQPSRVFRKVGVDEIESRETDVRDAVDEDLEDTEDMQGPHVTDRQRAIGHWLKTKARMPSSVLAVYYLLGLQTWGAFFMWMIGARWAASRDFGALYVGGSIICLILCNLGRRKPGEASGYSIFNAGCRRLPGDFDEDQIDNAFRGRM